MENKLIKALSSIEKSNFKEKEEINSALRKYNFENGTDFTPLDFFASYLKNEKAVQKDYGKREENASTAFAGKGGGFSRGYRDGKERNKNFSDAFKKDNKPSSYGKSAGREREGRFYDFEKEESVVSGKKNFPYGNAVKESYKKPKSAKSGEDTNRENIAKNTKKKSSDFKKGKKSSANGKKKYGAEKNFAKKGASNAKSEKSFETKNNFKKKENYSEKIKNSVSSKKDKNPTARDIEAFTYVRDRKK